MKKKLTGLLNLFLLLSVIIPSAAAQQSVGEIKNTTDETLQNSSPATNETSSEVQNTLNPIMDILNTFYSIINQIQHRGWMLIGGQ